jgi:hypothetical protein
MRRASESFKLLGRLAALAERTSSVAQYAAGSCPAEAALASRQLLQLGQRGHFHSMQCGRLLLPGGQVGQGRRLYQLVSLRQMSSGGGDAAESKIMSMMNQRLGKKAGDQLMYMVGAQA